MILANFANHPDPVLMLCFMAFSAGVILGIIIGQKLMARSVKTMISDSEKTKSDDPADWWKHGGDPYENVT